MKDSIILDPKYSQVGKDHVKSVDSFSKPICRNNSDSERAKEICECSYQKDCSVSKDLNNVFYQKFNMCVPDGSAKKIFETAISCYYPFGHELAHDQSGQAVRGIK